MRRIALIVLSVFLASGVAWSASLPGASEARGDAPAARVTGDVTSDPYFQVVDNDTKGRFRAPGWEEHPAGSHAYGDSYSTSESSAGAALFRVKIPEKDYYSVYARWPRSANNTQVVRFGVSTASGTTWEEVDQSIDGGYWVRIGAYEMTRGERVLKVVRKPGQRGRVVADAVMVIGDVLVGRNGHTASYADPEELAPENTGTSEPTYSAMGNSISEVTEVVHVAKRHLRTPYGHRPCRRLVREDCSCFTKLVYRRFGFRFADSPVRQWHMKPGRKIHNKNNLRRGDLVFHDLNRDGRLNDHLRDHVSIWVGHGNVIHASRYFGRVVISKESYLRGYWGAKRFNLSKYR